MKKKLRLLLVGTGLLAVGLAMFFDTPSAFGICFHHGSDNDCIAPYAQLAIWLYPISLAFLVTSSVLLAASRHTFSRWAKFSIGYGVLTALALWFLPQIGFGMGWHVSLFPIDQLSQLLAWIYVALSGILFLLSEYIFKPRKRQQ